MKVTVATCGAYDASSQVDYRLLTFRTVLHLIRLDKKIFQISRVNQEEQTFLIDFRKVILFYVRREGVLSDISKITDRNMTLVNS